MRLVAACCLSQEQLAVKSCNLLSVYGELERLKEENQRLEKQCNCVSRQLEQANDESTSEIQVICQQRFLRLNPVSTHFRGRFVV